MAFELTDFDRGYVLKGEMRGLFNVARSDESETEGATHYYAYMNESGSYVIQRVQTSGSLTIKVYDYYAKRGGTANMTALLNTDWAGRAGLTYVDYYALFNQG